LAFFRSQHRAKDAKSVLGRPRRARAAESGQSGVTASEITAKQRNAPKNFKFTAMPGRHFHAALFAEPARSAVVRLPNLAILQRVAINYKRI